MGDAAAAACQAPAGARHGLSQHRETTHAKLEMRTGGARLSIGLGLHRHGRKHADTRSAVLFVSVLRQVDLVGLLVVLGRRSGGGCRRAPGRRRAPAVLVLIVVAEAVLQRLAVVLVLRAFASELKPTVEEAELGAWSLT